MSDRFPKRSRPDSRRMLPRRRRRPPIGSATNSFRVEFAARFDEENNDRLTASLPLFPGDESDPGATPPRLIVSMTQDVAGRFAERVFVEVGMPSYSNLLGDCVAEFANLVAGRRRRRMTIGTPEHFLLGTPTFDSVPSGECLVAVLAGELGEVVIAVDDESAP